MCQGLTSVIGYQNRIRMSEKLSGFLVNRKGSRLQSLERLSELPSQ